MKFINSKTGIFVIYTLIVITATVFVTLSYKGSNTQIINSDVDQRLSPEKVEEVLAGLSNNIILPEGEEPVLAVITDVDALVQTQPFYSGSQNGDYLIIYPELARAIIYSLEKDIVINVGPVEFNSDPAAETEAGAENTQTPEEIFSDETVPEEAPVVDEAPLSSEAGL